MSHWMLGLAGRGDAASDPHLGGPEVDRIRASLGPGAVAWAHDTGAAIVSRITESAPTLVGRSTFLDDAMRRATTSTTLEAMALIRGIKEPDTSLAGARVTDIAGEFARLGLGLDDLLRTIRVGYAVLAASFLDAATELVPENARSEELRRIAVLLFEELDDFTDVAASAFLAEQAAWVAGVSAERLDLVTRIVKAEPVDLAHAQQVLDYPVDTHHVAMIVSCSPGSSRHDLRGLVEPVARQWGAPTTTLTIPVGSETIWSWSSYPAPPARRTPDQVPDLRDVRIAVGSPAVGVEGFRSSHLDADAAQRTVGLRSTVTSAITVHDDIALEVLLLADPDEAARFLDRTLGPLAANDPRVTDVRTTLRHYLDLDHSLAKVAAADNISRNTVTYRVQKAFQLCGYAGGSTTNVRAALRVHAWLNE